MSPITKLQIGCFLSGLGFGHFISQGQAGIPLATLCGMVAGVCLAYIYVLSKKKS